MLVLYIPGTPQGKEGKKMITTTIKDQHEKLAEATAKRIKKYLSKSWTEDGQDPEAVDEISNKISSSIMDWLLALHGPTAITTKAATAAKKAIKTHCYEDEATALADMYNEAINTINDLHNDATASNKQAKQAEKDNGASGVQMVTFEIK